MDEPPTGMAAAVAAMRAEWQMIAPELLREDDPEMLQEERDAVMMRRSQLVRGFMKRHRTAMEQCNLFGADLDTAELERLEKAVAKLGEKERKAEEQRLQAVADEAESQVAVAESMLKFLAQLEALSPEDWDRMEAARRADGLNALTQLRTERAAMLGVLPIERRRYWESR